MSTYGTTLHDDGDNWYFVLIKAVTQLTIFKSKECYLYSMLIDYHPLQLGLRKQHRLPMASRKYHIECVNKVSITDVSAVCSDMTVFLEAQHPEQVQEGQALSCN